MQIRRLKQGDEKLTCEIVMKFKGNKVSQEYMHGFLSNEKNYFVIALQNNIPVGFILGYELQRIGDEKPMMFLYEIGVKEEYRKKGIGKSLIFELQKICKEKDFLEMFVITNESNIPAMNLYQSSDGIRESRDDVVFVYSFK